MSTPSPKDYTVLICHHVLYVDCILTGFIAYWSSNKILFYYLFFGHLLVLYVYTWKGTDVIFFVKNLKFVQNGLSLFSAYFSSHFGYHSNR